MASDKDTERQLSAVREGTVTKTSDAVAMIKDGMLFANDWTTLLMSAPTVVKSLGTCFIASSSPLVMSIQLKKPAEGWKAGGYKFIR